MYTIGLSSKMQRNGERTDGQDSHKLTNLLSFSEEYRSVFPEQGFLQNGSRVQQTASGAKSM